MRPIFTIHAGEFLFGEKIQKCFPELELWLPVKDKGTDFLITRNGQDRPISIQVKMSRDYRSSAVKSKFDEKQLAGGWFSFNHDKIENSPADIWTLILLSNDRFAHPYFINLSPKELLKRAQAVHGRKKKYDLYPWVMKSDFRQVCVEGRGLKKKDREALATNTLKLGERDWTDFLNCWSFLKAT